VLKERQQLKYAALDCWQWVAEDLPQGITLQRFAFTDGQRVQLSGTLAQDQVDTLFNFDANLRKKKITDQFVFDQNAGDHVNPRFGNSGNNGTWNMSLELLHSEASPE
jgi:hypothetical protein